MNNCEICERNAESGNHMGFISKGTVYEFGNTTQVCQAPMPITLCNTHYSKFRMRVDSIFGAYVREAVSA